MSRFVFIAIDHFGHVCVEDCIRFTRKKEPYNLAWIEDMVPWIYTDQYIRLKNSTYFGGLFYQHFSIISFAVKEISTGRSAVLGWLGL